MYTNALRALRLFPTLLVAATVALCLTAPGFAQENADKNVDLESAWDVLVGDKPEIVDDPSLSATERKILQVLTPEQAEEYAQGGDAAALVLPNGETLADFIARMEAATEAGLVFRPLEPCVIADTRKAGEKLAADGERFIRIRGASADYSAQGGSATGCGIPGLSGTKLKSNRARALFLNIEVRDADGAGELQVWPADGSPSPRLGVISYVDAAYLLGFKNSTIVKLCQEVSLSPCDGGDIKMQAQGAGAHVVLSVLGYFETARLSSVANDPASLAEESPGEKSLTAPFWEQTGTDIFYADGNVGIGTTSPDVPLDVASAEGTSPTLLTPNTSAVFRYNPDVNAGSLVTILGGSNGNSQLTFGDDDHQWPGRILYSHTSDAMRFSTNLVEQMRIDLNGNLGIGTTTPDAPLDVVSAEGASPTMLTPNTVAVFRYNPDVNSGALVTILGGSSSNSQLTFADGDHQWPGRILYSHDLDVMRFYTNLSERLRIDSSGQVGIGTTTPDEALDVVGNVTASGTVCDVNGCIGSGSDNLGDHAATQNIVLSSHWLSGDGGNEGIRVNSLGNVGIGTPTPAQPLDVAGNVTASGTICDVNGCIGSGSDNLGNHQATQNITLGAHWLSGDGNSEGIRVDGAGNVGIGVTTPAQALDVSGNIKLSGNIVSEGDICIGSGC